MVSRDIWKIRGAPESWWRHSVFARHGIGRSEDGSATRGRERKEKNDHKRSN